MTLSTDIRQRAIALIEQLPPEQLTEAVRLLESLSNEKEWMKTIQYRLPTPEQQRLDDLRDRNEWGELTETEHQELLAYEDLREQQRVDRLEALMRLANIKNVDLETLSQQLKIT